LNKRNTRRCMGPGFVSGSNVVDSTSLTNQGLSTHHGNSPIGPSEDGLLGTFPDHMLVVKGRYNKEIVPYA
jgi:hypothetical protein